MKWVAFFSQSGSEIIELSKKLGKVPDVVVTNNRPSEVRTFNPELINTVDLIHLVPNRPDLIDYIRVLKESNAAPAETLITLHGWLRIIPKDIIAEYPYIFNGHPGLISKYPELKGKDPQKKAWDLNLNTSGCVIHQVTEGVDEGAILRSKEIPIRNLSMDQLFAKLHETSIELWVSFLTRHFDLRK